MGKVKVAKPSRVLPEPGAGDEALAGRPLALAPHLSGSCLLCGFGRSGMEDGLCAAAA